MSLASEGKLKAPAGKFRVVSVDTWAGPFADELVGDFGDKKAAMDAAKGAEGEHVKVYVYDDAGRLVTD